MIGAWPIFKREFKAYLQAPSTWIVLALVFLLAGYAFADTMEKFSAVCEQANSPMAQMYGMANQIPNVTDVVIRTTFGVFNMLMVFAIPMLAMRLLSEEKSRGTFELLVSCPVSDWGIIAGKYLALMMLGLGVIAISTVFPAIVWYFGRENGVAPEWPIVASCWAGLILIYASFAAFGVMASAFTESQITAAIVTAIGLLLWFMMSSYHPENPFGQTLINELSVSQHVSNLVQGMVQLKDLAFFVLTTFLFLFIATKTLDARRWRV